jgi:hypothetical protein
VLEFEASMARVLLWRISRQGRSLEVYKPWREE